MANVKVRKNRHLRTGADANPFPTAEQVLTGKVANVSERLHHKSLARMRNAGENNRAGASGGVVRKLIDAAPAVATALGASPVVAAVVGVAADALKSKLATKAKAKKKSKTRAKKAA